MLKKYVVIASIVVMFNMVSNINTNQFKGIDPSLDAQVTAIETEMNIEKAAFYMENSTTELSPYSDYIWSKAAETINEQLHHQCEKIAYSIYTDNHPEL